MSQTPLSRRHALVTIIVPLAIAETIIWAGCYYSFAAFILIWEQDFGWSKMALAGAFTSALVFSALLAPAIGRQIDLGRAKLVFTLCIGAGAILLFLLSRVTQYWQFLFLWSLIGVALAGMLYEACFSVITRCLGSDAKWAITIVTLIAGFAGTLSFPLAHYLTEFFGWRTALVIFSVVVLVIAMPLARIGCHNAEVLGGARTIKQKGNGEIAAAILHQPAFWLLAIAFTTLALNHGAFISHLLPILHERGIDAETAVLAASMIGPMQVSGRLALMASERHASIFAVAGICFVAVGLAAISLLFAGNAIWLLAIFVILQGAGYGLVSVIRPVITAFVLGQDGFGTKSGMIALPYMLGFAAGPTFAALLWRVGGYDLVIISSIVLVLAGFATLQIARRY